MMIQRPLSVLTVFACLASSVSSAADEVSFSRDVLPLLSNNCFKCHGPDEANREAGLRLDRHEASLAKLESGHAAIVPGQRAES